MEQYQIVRSITIDEIKNLPQLDRVTVYYALLMNGTGEPESMQGMSAARRGLEKTAEQVITAWKATMELRANLAITNDATLNKRLKKAEKKYDAAMKQTEDAIEENEKLKEDSAAVTRRLHE